MALFSNCLYHIFTLFFLPSSFLITQCHAAAVSVNPPAFTPDNLAHNCFRDKRWCGRACCEIGTACSPLGICQNAPSVRSPLSILPLHSPTSPPQKPTQSLPFPSPTFSGSPDHHLALSRGISYGDGEYDLWVSGSSFIDGTKITVSASTPHDNLNGGYGLTQIWNRTVESRRGAFSFLTTNGDCRDRAFGGMPMRFIAKESMSGLWSKEVWMTVCRNTNDPRPPRPFHSISLQWLTSRPSFQTLSPRPTVSIVSHLSFAVLNTRPTFSLAPTKSPDSSTSKPTLSLAPRSWIPLSINPPIQVTLSLPSPSPTPSPPSRLWLPLSIQSPRPNLLTLSHSPSPPPKKTPILGATGPDYPWPDRSHSQHDLFLSGIWFTEGGNASIYAWGHTPEKLIWQRTVQKQKGGWWSLPTENGDCSRLGENGVEMHFVAVDEATGEYTSVVTWMVCTLGKVSWPWPPKLEPVPSPTAK